MPEIRPETLRPLPLRVTQRQYLRLQAHRQIDQLAIQEHVRRALDDYLDKLDRKRPLERVAPSVLADPADGEEDGMDEKPDAGPDPVASAATPAAKSGSGGGKQAAAPRVAKTPAPRRPSGKIDTSRPKLAMR